jgi:hypothetical protein
MVVRSINRCFNENSTMPSIFIVVGLTVFVNNMKSLIVAFGKQQCVSFALLWSYKIFRTAVKNVKVLRSSRNVSDALSGLTKFGVSGQLFLKVADVNITKLHPVGAVMIHADTQTDRRDEDNRPSCPFIQTPEKQNDNLF